MPWNVFDVSDNFDRIQVNLRSSMLGGRKGKKNIEGLKKFILSDGYFPAYSATSG